jgi:hypothetical protein
MTWSFHGLDTSHGWQELNESLTYTVHSAIKIFVKEYEYLKLNLDYKLYDDNPGQSFKSLCSSLNRVVIFTYLLMNMIRLLRNQCSQIFNYYLF